MTSTQKNTYGMRIKFGSKGETTQQIDGMNEEQVKLVVEFINRIRAWDNHAKLFNKCLKRIDRYYDMTHLIPLRKVMLRSIKCAMQDDIDRVDNGAGLSNVTIQRMRGGGHA